LHEIVIDFVIVTAPKPPGSMQLMMPPAAVFEIAPAHVLHGAVRLQGLASSPTPDTQVRVAWAKTLPLASRSSTDMINELRKADLLCLMTLPLKDLMSDLDLHPCQ
jgi:hypothetical protein